MRRRLAVGLAVSGGLLGSGWTGPLHAGPPPAPPACADARHWVAVRFEGEWDAAFVRAVLADLRLSLGRATLAVCRPGQGQGRPLGEVVVRPRGAETVQMKVHLRDAVTKKELARDIDLSSIPQDARDLALSMAVDELLRASWAELDLHRRSQQSTTPGPAPVRRAVAQVRKAPARPRRVDLELLAVGSLNAAGQPLLGGDLAVGVELLDGLAARMVVGGAHGGSRSFDHGAVDATALGGELGLRGTLLTTAAFSLQLTGGVRVAAGRFDGEAAPGAAPPQDHAGVVISGRLGPTVELRLSGPWSLVTQGGFQGPLRTLTAQEDGAAISRLGDWGGYGGVGVRVDL